MEPPVDFSTQTRDARDSGAAGAHDGSSELIRTRDELAGAFRTLVAAGEELMRQTSNLPGDAVVQARERFREALTAAQSRIGEFGAQAREKGRTAAVAADRYVHDEPWMAIGVAAGVGLAAGALLFRRP